jgi:hypothetical protein
MDSGVVAVEPFWCENGRGGRQFMKRLNGVTVLFLSLAGLWSVALTLLAFVVDIPVRRGTHNLVQTASGGYQEAKVLPQTYFQAYGVPELLLTGTGIVAAALVAVLLSHRRRSNQPNAGRAAWGVSIAALVVGIIGFVTVYLLFVGIFLTLACLTFSKQQATAKRSQQQALSATPRTSG